MAGEKFNLQNYPVSHILGMIRTGKFVIPEIQRPFVWKRSQVKDLIDSLYNGYPVGYLITWQNPDIITKDGTISNGKHLLIDGQQRILALTTAILGMEVLDSNFKKGRIKIAFNPMVDILNPADKTERFAIQDASHLRDKRWIPDISEIFADNAQYGTTELSYAAANNITDISKVFGVFGKLRGIVNRQIGIIDLSNDIEIDEVTDIFVRINSKGTQLNQSDFVMSKMAADSEHGGNTLRKVVDYVCHLAAKPEFYDQLKKDTEFQKTEFASKIQWFARNNDDIYIPEYSDMIRVAFMCSFDRAKIADLVSLLSGRDFQTREYKSEIIEDSYNKLKTGILKFINQYDFQQFLLAIKGAGFNSIKLLNSKVTLDFAYTLYLKLRDDSNINQGQIKRLVQKWFVLSTLTGRYITSPESSMSRDIRQIDDKGFLKFAKEIEDSDLSDNFWNVTLPQNLETTSTNSPAFNTFLAAQNYFNSDSMFMKGTKISYLLNLSGDVHHIFPKAYLINNGIETRTRYNQVANYTYLDTQINKAISDDSPRDYFGKILKQCQDKNVKIGNITDENELKINLSENAIPQNIINMTVNDYDDFLIERRKLMAKIIEKY